MPPLERGLIFKIVQFWTEVNPSMAYAGIGLEKTLMRRNYSQLRVIVNSPAPSAKLTDTAGNPSESYHWRQMAAVRREWQHEFWRPYVDAFELTLAEITNIETRVRRELYP